MCEEKGETVHHIVSECKKMAQKEYKRRHENVARMVHWHLCKKYNLERTEKLYEHTPVGVVENDEVKAKEDAASLILRYQDLKREIKGVWNMKSVIVVPVIVGVLGSVTKKLDDWLENWISQ
eukprot:gene2688-biopygen1093